jgi:hypothetical protein
MPQDNIEVVRQMCDAFARGDWQAAARPLHPSIVWDMSTYGAWPEQEVSRGRQGVLEFFRRFLFSGGLPGCVNDNDVAGETELDVTELRVRAAKARDCL